MTDHELTIDKTWDGQPLRAWEQATVRLSLGEEALRIVVDAPFGGDPPPPGPPGATPGLWNHEVVELFVVAEGEQYTEIELSPHGHHWVLRLDGIRNPVESGIAITHEASVVGPRWRAVARVPRAVLPEKPRWCNAFRIAGTGEARRFFAWHPVPGDGPNFHRLEHFGPWPFPSR